MEEVLEKKLLNIELLLIELHAKIDNFLGFETLTEDEKKELTAILGEIQAGQIEIFEKVFVE